jgi:hypothetical protein
MSEEIILTLVIPLCIVGGTWLAMAMLATSKKRRIQRRMEQGVADYLARFKPHFGTQK